jgi:hypothetical protein
MVDINKHHSTMTSEQRSMLINVLKIWHNMEKLATLTDPQLHELWIEECEYPNPYKEN